MICIVNIVHAKETFDDVACKHLLLATSAAKEFFEKHYNNVDFSFLHDIRIIISFLYCELSCPMHGVVRLM